MVRLMRGPCLGGVVAAVVVLGWPGGVGLAAPPGVLPSGLKPEEVEKRKYVDYARECVEVLIEHGTDRYGKVQSPLLMNILDVRTPEEFSHPQPLPAAYRVGRHGRRGPAGGNLYPDQPTIRAMHLLSRVTGEPKYAAFADRCVAYTMKELVLV